MAGPTANALTLFVTQSVVIIAAARSIGWGARKLGQPLVIAEIAAGILLGPSLLGYLAPDLLNTLFPASSMSLLSLFSQVGLIFFMFLIGLELDPKLLRSRGHASVVISHASIIAPFALGAILALYLYPTLAPPDVPFSSFVLFLGISMSITAFPVLARIMAERQILKTHIGAITIACAAVDDVTAWCLLAFVTAIVRSSGLGGAAMTTMFALAYIGFMFAVIKPFLARIGSRAGDRLALTQNAVAITFLLLMLSSLATEMIGIHALFGAFLFGAIMPREGAFVKSLAEKLEDFVVVFLLPLFFAYSGLRTQINLLNSPEAWLMCGLIIMVACAGKFGGSALAARFTGLNWRESCAIGVLMNTRGLMELIVLNIGLDLGVISPALFTMMVIMALVTTFMTTPLLQMFYPQHELQRELAQQSDANARPAFNLMMCVANEQVGPPMATLAAALGGKDAATTRLHALRLLSPPDRSSAFVGTDDDDIRSALAPLIRRSDELGIHVRPISFVSAAPADDICAIAAAKHSDLVLLGWHRPLLNQTLLGGTVYDVMKDARTDVAVLIDRGLKSVKRVLLPVNGSPHDMAALRLARRLHEQNGAEIVVLHVVKPNRTDEKKVGAADALKSAFSESKTSNKVSLKVVEHEYPPTAALEECRNGYDLVIVSVGSEWGVEQRQFGLHPEQIIRDCTTSMLVVRHFEGSQVMAPLPQVPMSTPRVPSGQEAFD